MDGEKGTRTTVYNTKRDSRKREEKKEKEKKRAKGERKTTLKQKEFRIIDHTIRTYPKMLFVWMHE